MTAADLAAGAGPVFDLRHYFPHGVTPEEPDAVGQALHTASEAVAAAGGGVLYVPPGTWRLRANYTAPRAAVLLGTPGMRLCGAGMRATQLHLLGGEECDIVVVRAPGVTIERMTIRGNLDELPPKLRPHGIVVRADPTFVALRDLVVEAVAGYAVFFHALRDDPGIFTHVTLRNVVIRTCGNDGVDFKVKRATEDKSRYPPPPDLNPGPRGFLRNMAIDDHSTLYPNATRAARGENGVDVRGQLHLHNIEVLNVKPGAFGQGGASGIALRLDARSEADNPRDDHGVGGAWSSVENYFVSRLPPLPGSRSRGGGILIPEAIRDCVFISNGQVRDL